MNIKEALMRVSSFSVIYFLYGQILFKEMTIPNIPDVIRAGSMNDAKSMGIPNFAIKAEVIGRAPKSTRQKTMTPNFGFFVAQNIKNTGAKIKTA